MCYRSSFLKKYACNAFSWLKNDVTLFLVEVVALLLGQMMYRCSLEQTCNACRWQCNQPTYPFWVDVVVRSHRFFCLDRLGFSWSRSLYSTSTRSRISPAYYRPPATPWGKPVRSRSENYRDISPPSKGAKTVTDKLGMLVLACC